VSRFTPSSTVYRITKATRTLALGALLCARMGVMATAVAEETVEARAVEEFLLAVSINGQKPDGTVLIVRNADRGLLARREDLLSQRLLVPVTNAVSMDGELFYPLDALAGLTYRLDEAQQVLMFDAPAALFSGTRVTGSRGAFVVPTPSPAGGFLNYDAFAVKDPKLTSVNGLAEVGVFKAASVGVSSFLRQDLPEGAREVRLATTWTQDHPAQMTSLRVGDFVSASSGWGRSVRLGGVQWATNFSTQPSLITFPRPGMSGEAVVPSTLELYINDALRLRRDVPAGPFNIEEMPVLTGRGEARLVVTDLLGREQIIVAPYYASSQLLQQGLQAYSYEVGAIREDFGLASNHYGRGLALGTFQHGFTDQFTGEVHAELLENQQTLGGAGVFLLPAIGVFSASIAVSESGAATGIDAAGRSTATPGGTGGLLGLAFQGQRDWLGYGASVQVTSAHFAQVGLEPGQPAPRQTRQAFVSVATNRLGSVGLSYVYQDRRDGYPTELLNASYSMTLGNLGFLSLSVLRICGSEATSVFGLNFTRKVGLRDTGSYSASKDKDSTEAYVRLHRSLPAGEGMGYRLLAGSADSDRRQAAISLQNQVGTYSAEVDSAEGVTSYRGSVSGGIASLGTDAFFSRRIDSSFAVVQVPGYADVTIYQDNQPVARTNAQGAALVARLRPYEVNSVRIEQANLPMDAQFDALQLDATPYLRSGLLLSFPVRRSRGAVYNVVLDNGEPLPAGAVAQIVGQAEEFPVGLGGQVYMTGLDATNQVAVTWRGQRCEFALAFPDSGDPLPDLGTHQCHGVAP
jgi:outer membrane usher protein